MKRWWVGLAGVLLVPSCAQPLNGGLRYFPDPTLYGWSYCYNDQPVGWVNIKLIGTPDEVGTIAHERMHGQQMLRQGTCERYSVWLATHRAEAEAEAFCEEVKIESAPPFTMSRGGAKLKYGAWLARAYPQFGLNIADAIQLLNKFC